MKLITNEIENAILKTPYGSTENIEPKDKKVIAKLFNPYGVGTWYILEDSMYRSDKIVFGAVDLGYGVELGDFSIQELEGITSDAKKCLLTTRLSVERDRLIKPFKHTLGELMESDGLKFMYE